MEDYKISDNSAGPIDNTNNAVKNGLFLGAALVIGTFAIAYVSPRGFITYGSYVLFLIALIIMVKTGIEAREANGGFAAFGTIFKAIFICILVAYGIRFIGNYVAYNVVFPNLIEIQKELSIEVIEKMSGLMGDEATELAIEEIESQGGMSIANILGQFVMLLILTGCAVNAIISLILRREKPIFES